MKTQPGGGLCSVCAARWSGDVVRAERKMQGRAGGGCIGVGRCGNRHRTHAPRRGGGGCECSVFGWTKVLSRVPEFGAGSFVDRRDQTPLPRSLPCGRPPSRPGPAGGPGSCPSLQWIQPTKTVESREIMIGAVQFRLMFHGERGELGVGCQIGGRPELGKIVHEEPLETGAGVQEPDRGLGQPGAHVADG